MGFESTENAAVQRLQSVGHPSANGMEFNLK
jgi:hypothetical protein